MCMCMVIAILDPCWDFEKATVFTDIKMHLKSVDRYGQSLLAWGLVILDRKRHRATTNFKTGKQKLLCRIFGMSIQHIG